MFLIHIIFIFKAWFIPSHWLATLSFPSMPIRHAILANLRLAGVRGTLSSSPSDQQTVIPLCAHIHPCAPQMYCLLVLSWWITLITRSLSQDCLIIFDPHEWPLGMIREPFHSSGRQDKGHNSSQSAASLPVPLPEWINCQSDPHLHGTSLPSLNPDPYKVGLALTLGHVPRPDCSNGIGVESHTKDHSWKQWKPGIWVSSWGS